MRKSRMDEPTPERDAAAHARDVAARRHRR